MIQLFNTDTSYFKIGHTNANLATAQTTTAPAVYKDISDQVIKLDVTEEVGKAITGSLQINDNDSHEASSILRPGRYVQIQWGYTRRDYSGMELYTRAQNPDELYSATTPRRVLVARIREVSGGADTAGKITYNCNFVGYDGMGRGQTESVVYTSRTGAGRYVTTKGDVVRDTFIRMGVNSFFIGFRREAEPVTSRTPIRRNRMSAFRFLNYLANEWRCVVRIGYDQNRTPIGLFTNYDYDNQINGFVQSVTGAFGNTLLYEYKSGKENVKSYNWQYQLAGGDSATLVNNNGNFQLVSQSAETQKIITYELRPENISRDFAGVSTTERFRILQSMLELGTMEELIDAGYFVARMSTTAPQGSGLSLNLDTIGNPYCTCPGRIMFGKGFPNLIRSQVKTRTTRFYVSKVSHVIDRSGYLNKIEVKDTFSLYGGSLVR